MSEQEPAAWAVVKFTLGTVLATSVCRSDAVDMQFEHACDTRIVPLYLQPQPTLTDEERAAINEAADSYDDGCNERCREMTKILRGLLERLGGSQCTS